ncbi:MAG TPA: hypothetical protein VMW19_02595 [Myxococcota bacterium]|nr:hypothetical protein [Myxococcota bacterium]
MKKGRLVSSFYPKPGLACSVSGVLDVAFDESDVAKTVEVDEDAKCL